MDSSTGSAATSASTSLAGLIGVLDRVDGPAGALGRRRLPAPRPAGAGARSSGIRTAGLRATGIRAAGFRATAVRSVPLRSVQPAPRARRPAGTPVIEPGSYWDMTRAPVPVAPEPAPRRTPGRGAALVRRAALWGAGRNGEHLAWRTSAAVTALTKAATPPTGTAPAAEVAPRGPRLRTLVRRMALWGAGENGANLAWGRAPMPRPAARLDPPVVLREMPSTPRIQPVPVVTVPAAPVPAVRRPIGPVLPRVAPVAPVGWVAPAGPAPVAGSGWPAPPSGWPQPPVWPPVQPAAARRPRPPLPTPSFRARRVPALPSTSRSLFASPRERGLARARGDPLCSSARGSPAHAAPG
jgi:hypothetical protein